MLTPHDSSPKSLAEPGRSDAETVLREACDEIEQRITSGQAARSEEYLARHPALAQDAEQALDLIFVEYTARRDLGETPTHEEYFARFPQWQVQLQRQFQLDDLLDEPTPSQDELDVNPATSSPSGQAGTSGGRFRVLALHARGGIGQVMRAVDTEFNREVAVKELQPALADSEDVRERFLREAEITGKLEHPGIVPVYGLGRDPDGRPFYAMRLVRGQSFQDAVLKFHQRASGSHRFMGVEFQKLLRRFLHVCETVAFAHSRGIIHRDLKPANILLGPFGETLVVDWGLARATGPEGPQPAIVAPRSVATDPLQSQPTGSLTTPVAHWSNELTQVSGELIGTPAFMSPEQASGTARDVGPAGDVYSLGATLYMLLTGRAPFVGTEVGETLARVASGRFGRPRELNRAIPRALEAVCLKAMARRPEDRYPSPRELADDLEHWLADEPVTAAHEPLVARIGRWGRRHRAHVIAGSLALLLVTMVSVVAAIRINNERLRADRERIEANRRNTRLAFDRGYALTQDHEYGAAMHWFARSLEHAPLEDAAMRRVILTNIDAVRHHLLRRRRVFAHPASLATLAFSSDGKRLLTADTSGNGRLWDAETGTILVEHHLPAGRVVAGGFSTDGAAILATFKGGELSLQRLPSTGTSDADSSVTISHAEELASAAISPDGQLLAAGSRNLPAPKARFWCIANRELVAELDHPRTVTQIAFQPQSSSVATTCEDGRVRLWLAQEKRLIREFRAIGSSIQRVSFTPDGKRLLAGDSAGCVSCWDVENGRRLFDVARHSGSVTAVTCATDGQTIAAAWDTGMTRTWNLETRRPASELLRLDRFTRNLAFRPWTQQLVIASQPTNLVLWDLPNPDRLAPPLNQPRIESVAFSQDGKVAVTGSFSWTARLRDGVTGKSFGKILQHQAAVKAVAFRPDGEVVLTASHDGTARLWKSAGGTPHGAPLDHHPTPTRVVQVEAAAFSPDGLVVVTGDSAGVIRAWDGDTGELIRIIDDLQGTATSVGFSPDGERIVAGFGAPENGVRVWKSEGGEGLWTGSHRGPVRTVAFSPDGRLVISASNDETVRLWAVPTGEPIGEPMRHDGIVMAAAFSPDGMRLLTGSGDRSARLWDVATCLPLSPPLPHGNRVSAVAINPAGNTALTGRLWHLPTPLPDDLPLVKRWVQLATERSFTAGDSIEWLAPAALDDLAREFEARAGKSWSDWAD